MPLFGGNASGKKRADGLKPGSPEAVAADKERDARRKRDTRAAELAAAEPAALPAASPGGPAQPGIVAVDFPAAAAVAAVVAWEADKLKPLTDQMIGLVEDVDVGSFTKVARAGELPEKVVRKIEADSHWPRAGKLMLERAAPKLAAKYMNQTGVSAAYQDEMELMAGMSAVIVSRQKLMKELREMVAEFKQGKAESGKAESAKP